MRIYFPYWEELLIRRNVKLIGKEKLVEFTQRHPDVESFVQAWEQELKQAEWKSPLEMKQRFGTASVLGKGATVFDIKGNHYRIDVDINYKFQVIVVRRCGTHREYDKWKWPR